MNQPDTSNISTQIQATPYSDSINQKISDSYDNTREVIEWLLFLEERDKKQLSDAQAVWVDLYASILEGIRQVRIGLLEGYEKIFIELCDWLCEDAEKYLDSFDTIFQHSELKKREFQQLLAYSRIHIAYLWIMDSIH